MFISMPRKASCASSCIWTSIKMHRSRPAHFFTGHLVALTRTVWEQKNMNCNVLRLSMQNQSIIKLAKVQLLRSSTFNFLWNKPMVLTNIFINTLHKYCGGVSIKAALNFVSLYFQVSKSKQIQICLKFNPKLVSLLLLTIKLCCRTPAKLTSALFQGVVSE